MSAKRSPAVVGVEDAPVEKAAPVPQAKGEPVAATESKNIGNWVHGLWKGIDMWTNRRTHRTSFKRDFVRKHRHE